MALIFAKTTTCLATEFVNSFSAETLAHNLVRVKKETGVEFNRRYRNFNIIGEWDSIIAAYKSFENILQEQSVLTDDYHNINCNGTEELPLSGKHSEGPGRKPGHTLKPSEHCVPAPLVYIKCQAQEPETKFGPNNNSQKEGAHSTSLTDEPPVNVSLNLQTEPCATSSESLDDKIIACEDYIEDREDVIWIKREKKIDNEDECDDNADLDEEYSPNADHEYQLDNVQSLKIKQTNSGDKIIDKTKKKVKRKPKKKYELGEFPCDLCSYVGKRRVNLEDHKKRQHKRKHKCEVCNKAFGVAFDLKRHMKAHETEKKAKRKSTKPLEENVEYSCKLCSYTGKRKINLSDHMKRKHRNKFTCEVCEKQFGFITDYKRHINRVHAEPQYPCDKCDKAYKTQRILIEHQKSHEADFIKPIFVCEICEKSFSTKYVLASHIKSAHLGLKKSFMCPICGKTFSQRGSYVSHANKHAGIKPHVCDVCGRAFTYDTTLKEHKYMHDTVRHFQCHICEKAFRQSTGLRTHMKIHQGRKDYICTSCGKGFTQMQALLRHERIHTGVKPFVCALCNKAFSDYSIIRRHLILIHKKHPKKWREHVITTTRKEKEDDVKAQSQGDENEKEADVILSVKTKFDTKPQNNSYKRKPPIVEFNYNAVESFQYQVPYSEPHTKLDSGHVPINYSMQVSSASNVQQNTEHFSQTEHGQSVAQVSLPSSTQQDMVHMAQSVTEQPTQDHYPGVTVNNDSGSGPADIGDQSHMETNQSLRWGYALGGYEAYYNMGNMPHYTTPP